MTNNPTGWTLGDKKTAEKHVEEIEKKIASMETKWQDVFQPQLEQKDEESSDGSTSTAISYDRSSFKSESKNFALKHFGLYPENNSNSQNLNEEVSNFSFFFKVKKNLLIKFLFYVLLS